MKKSAFLLVMILVLPLFLQSPTHAALTPYSNSSLTSIKNCADLFYPNFFGGSVGVGNTVGDINPVANNSSYYDNFEYAVFGGNSYESGHSGVNFSGNATADSGVSDGTLYSSAYASMTYEGFTGGTEDTPGVEAEQLLTAQFTQYYYDPDGGTMQISGLLDLGESIFFDVMNTDGVFSYYSISGSVSVNEKAFTGETSGNNAVFLSLSPDNLSDSAIVFIQPGTMGNGYYYEVTTSLTINASLDNVEVNPVIADAFSGNQFIIGDSDNPIMVTASWSAVPVPSSLLLLISGVAGISFIRRRRS